MKSSYTKQVEGADNFRFTIKAAMKDVRFPIAPTGAAVLFALVVVGSMAPDVGFFGWAFRWIFAIGGAWAVFRAVKWYGYRTGPKYTFLVSPRGAVAGTGEVIPRDEVDHLLWVQWEDHCALYAESKQKASHILATGMDAETVQAVGIEAALILGVNIEGGTPDQNQQRDETRDAAKKRLAEIRAGFKQDFVTTATQPMRTGDLVLTETQPNVYEIQELKASGRERVMSVPFDDIDRIFKWAENYAGDRNLWLEKIADTTGHATLMPKAQANKASAAGQGGPSTN